MLPRKLHSKVLSLFLLVLAVAPALLLLFALRQETIAAPQFRDVDLSGSLRFRSLRAYGTSSLSDRSATRTTLEEMARIRADLRTRYPSAVTASDPPWKLFQGEFERTGKLSWPTADLMRMGFQAQTARIADLCNRQALEASRLLSAGLVGMALLLSMVVVLLGNLRRSEREQSSLTEVLNSTTDLVAIADRQGRIFYHNRALREFVGSDLNGRMLTSLRAPSTVKGLDREILQNALDRGSWQGETELLDATGREVPVSLVVLCQRDELNHPDRFSLMARDVTAARESLLELQKTLFSLQGSQALFSSSLDAMQEGFVVQDAEGIVLICNPQAERILKVSSSPYVGSKAVSPDWETIDESGTLVTRAEQPSRMAFQTGKQQPERVLGLRRPAQPLQWLRFCSSPVYRPEATTPHAVVVTLQDITVQRNTATLLQQSEERLRRLQALTTQRNLSLEQKIDRLLQLGCEFFRLNAGFLASTGDGQFEVKFARSENDWLSVGQSRPLEETYCSRVLAAGEVLSQQHVALTDWTQLPVYAALGLESYIGSPLWTGDNIYGTLCFASRDPIAHEFTDNDKEILQLMSQWIGGEIEHRRAQAERELYNQKLEALATLDGLTGLKNRRFFQENLNQEMTRTSRYQSPLSLIILDVDHFKQYNDTFGHPEGDQVLVSVARLLQESVRETDLVGRYGGEEFVVLLPQTDLDGAHVIAERIRESIAGGPWLRRDITVSVGVAEYFPSQARDATALIGLADQALYRSKSAGRNRVSLAEPAAIPDP